MIMAVAVATCSPTIYARYGDSAVDTSRSCAHCPPMIAGISTAWPRLDTGNSSVIPCRSPMTPASAYVRCDMPALRSPPTTGLKTANNDPERSGHLPRPAAPASPRRTQRVSVSPATSHRSRTLGPLSPASPSLNPHPRGAPPPRTLRPDAKPRGLKSSCLAGDLRGVLVGPAADLVAQPDQRVVLAPHHPFLQRDQRVVGDLDVLRADL